MIIDVTDVAKDEIKKVLGSKSTEKSLKVYIASYGWGGPSFGLALDELKDGDELIKSDEFEFIVEEGLSDNYGKFTIDYSDNWLKKGFSVIPDRGGSSCS